MTKTREEELEESIIKLWKSNLTPLEYAIEVHKKGIAEGRRQEQERSLEIIKKDIMLFEDARDILIDLKRQGVGTCDCEKLFDERVKELKLKLKEIK